jgi:hypothetical protein
VPPLAIVASRLRRPSSESPWEAFSPDDFSAALRVASSYSSKGSKLDRRVPTKSVQQCDSREICITDHSKVQAGTAVSNGYTNIVMLTHRLRDDGNIRTQGIKIDLIRR